MFDRRRLHLFLIPPLLATLAVQGCKRADERASNAPATPATPPAASSAIETEIVTQQAVDGAIAATGKVLVPEDRAANVGPVNEGRILRLYAGQGTVVRKGQKLADLESPDVDEAEADYLKALADYENAKRTSAAEVKLAQSTYDRTKMLYEKTIKAGKELESAEHDLEVAKASADSSLAGTKAALAAARRKLLILGLTERDVDELEGKPSAAPVFSLTSPIAGTVVERDATLGATVGTDATVFKIVDTSRVWVDANVFEKDLGRVRKGQQVRVTVPAYPGSTFLGTVILVSTAVDPDSRTVQVRTEVPNADGRLKPDMFANVEVVTDVHGAAVSVPQTAVLDDGGTSVVFVANGADYAKRPVTVGIASGDRVEIVDGLATGDRVVVKGNYLLLQQSAPEQ